MLSFLRGNNAGRDRKSFLKSPPREFFCYYGPPENLVGKLGKVQMAFVELMHGGGDIAKTLAGEVDYLIAYCSCGEAVGDLIPKLPKEANMGHNRYGWESYYGDPANPTWARILIEHANNLLSKGADGLLLDTVDTVDIFPQIHQGMVQLIRNLRKRFPNRVIILNRGFKVFADVQDVVDGVMFESMMHKDFSAADRDWVEGMCGKLKKSGLPIFSINYLDCCDPEECRQMAEDYGFYLHMAPDRSLMNLP